MLRNGRRVETKIECFDVFRDSRFAFANTKLLLNEKNVNPSSDFYELDYFI